MSALRHTSPTGADTASLPACLAAASLRSHSACHGARRPGAWGAGLGTATARGVGDGVVAVADCAALGRAGAAGGLGAGAPARAATSGLRTSAWK